MTPRQRPQRRMPRRTRRPPPENRALPLPTAVGFVRSNHRRWDRLAVGSTLRPVRSYVYSPCPSPMKERALGAMELNQQASRPLS